MTVNKTNLRKLMVFLRDLDNYIIKPKFDMDVYFTDGFGIHPYSPVKQEHMCGTSACAVGHATLVPGLEAEETDARWYTYIPRVFGFRENSDEHCWLFSAMWSNSDNTPEGAAARIECYLKEGIPTGFKGMNNVLKYKPDLYKKYIK